jgi:hypothetical protein
MNGGIVPVNGQRAAGSGGMIGGIESPVPEGDEAFDIRNDV